jgi:DNA polymerase V
MQCLVSQIIVPDFSTNISRPLLSSKVSAGFPSPAEDYVEGRIDLNRDLIKHSLSTFYIRVVGDSMEPDIKAGALLIVDKMMETKHGDIVVVRFGDELCVKEIQMTDDGMIRLVSRNPEYKAFPICEEDDFEVWGRVMHIIHSC